MPISVSQAKEIIRQIKNDRMATFEQIKSSLYEIIDEAITNTMIERERVVKVRVVFDHKARCCCGMTIEEFTKLLEIHNLDSAPMAVIRKDYDSWVLHVEVMSQKLQFDLEPREAQPQEELQPR